MKKGRDKITSIVGDGIAALQTNVSRIYGFNYAPYIPDVYDLVHDRPQNKNTLLNVSFYVTNIAKILELSNIDLKGKGILEKVSEHCYLTDTNDVICYRDAKFFKLVMLLRIDKNRIDVLVNRPYYALIRLPIGGLLPPGCHLNSFVYLKLLQNGYLSLHAAAVDTNSGSLCMIGHSNVGKTLTAFKLVKKGYSIIGEDVIVTNVNNRMLYAVPYAQTWMHNSLIISDLHKLKLINTVEKIKLSLKQRIAHFPILPFFINFELPSKLFNLLPIRTTGMLRCITLLKPSFKESTYERLDSEEKRRVAAEIMRINHIEFGWLRDPLVTSFELIEGDQYSIQNLLAKEENLIHKLLRKIDVFVIYAKKSEDFHKVIEKILKEEC
ncbi:MAG: hypothetical protein ACTSXX_08420 [Candidatus Baldrarchaeia archaeon]